MIDHMGKPDLKIPPEELSSSDAFKDWVDVMTQFASFKNMHVKLSGLPTYLPFKLSLDDLEEGLLSAAPWVYKLLEVFGTRRVVWGSDWPVLNLNDVARSGNWGIWRRTTEKMLVEGSLTSSQLEDIFHNNAVRIYNL